MRDNEMTFQVAERYKDADLKSIGMLLRAEWGISAEQADDAVREFFEEDRQ